MFNPLRLAIAVGMIGFGIVVVGSRAQAQVAGPTAKSEADPLLTLNNASRVFYTQAKTTALEHHGPVIIVVGDDLVLRKGKDRLQARVIPEMYHTLKAIAHVPMAIDVALAAQADEKPFHSNVRESYAEILDLAEPAAQRLHDRATVEGAKKADRSITLPVEFIQELRDYRALLPAAEARLATAGLSPEDRERQKAILAACGAFLDSVIAKRQCSTRQRTSFTRRMNPLVMANASAAARAALDSLDRQVAGWKSQMKPEEWHRVSALVIGRQLPRKDNLAVQYFSRLLGENGEGGRIFYAEGLAEEPRALDLLATHLVDTQIADDFFNDSERMNRDLLSDSARTYLPLLIDEHHWSHTPTNGNEQ